MPGGAVAGQCAGRLAPYGAVVTAELIAKTLYTVFLFVDVKQEGGFLCVVVEDNGVGLRSDRFDEHMQGTGSGLHILFRTAELWNKKNVQKIEIGLVNLGEADEKKNGIRFTAQIPLHFNYKL